MSSTAGSAASSEFGVTIEHALADDLAESSPVVACIVGPTAAGKSALAMQLAESHGLAIVSADSRQVYRHFDVGTAKPTREERDRVPHFGIDVVDPTERYSAHRWATDAAVWSARAVEQGTPPLIVGGTGLYVRALVQPFDDIPDLDASQRRRLEPFLASLSLPELARWCARLDPARAHLGRTQLLRAIETALLSGVRLGDRLGDRTAGHAETGPLVRYLVVDPGPILASRIAERVHHMIAQGFVEEIERLRHEIPPEAPAWKASGYAVMRSAVEGSISMAAAIERVIIETRQYAKRQRTWFRHQLPAAFVTHVDPLHRDAVSVTAAWWDAVARTSGGRS